jgi:phosphoribosyl 1,2-cyclic phosphodiesterase
MRYNVLKTGSKGNCVIYHNYIAVDMGVPYKTIEPYVKDLKIILLTHSHKDHINISTLRRIQLENPRVRIGCCNWMFSYVIELKNVDVYETNIEYEYNGVVICAVKLYHDVPNCGYRIKVKDYSIFHATDTVHLEGIKAKGYDLYAIEHNFDEDKIVKTINQKRDIGEYAYEIDSIKTHLSLQKAQQFIIENCKEDSEILMLHQSENNI